MAAPRSSAAVYRDQFVRGVVQGCAITTAKLGHGSMRFVADRSGDSERRIARSGFDWCSEIEPVLREDLLLGVKIKFQTVPSASDDPDNQFLCYGGAAMIAIVGSFAGGSFGAPSGKT